MKRNLLVFALCICAVGAHAEVYKWIDADGKIQYGDAPPKNVKATVVSGGVTVVPAMVMPPAPPAAQSKPEAGGSDEGARQNTSRKPDGDAAPASTSPDPAAARAEARMKAIERCKSNRGADCENEVDAQINGQTSAGYIPGWSLPPIRPNHPAGTMARSPASPSKPSPRPPSMKETAASAPVSEHPPRSSSGIKLAR